jgi:hypothetical protein
VGQALWYLIRDRDRAFQAVTATAGVMGIEDMRTAPRSPWQNRTPNDSSARFAASVSIMSLC